MRSTLDNNLTTDDFLDGRLRIRQPATGYRAGADPVLLAAACPARPNDTVLELGCGVGTAILCLGRRVPNLQLTGVEIQSDYADLAQSNAQHNGLDLTIVQSDLADMPLNIRQTMYHHVIANPPYFKSKAGTSSTDDGKDIAFRGETPLDTWVDIGARRLRPKGVFTLIQRIDRLPETLTAMQSRLGSIVILPLSARYGRDPHLFIARGRKGGRADFRQLFPKILHDGLEHISDGDDYCAEIKGILRDGDALQF